ADALNDGINRVNVVNNLNTTLHVTAGSKTIGTLDGSGNTNIDPGTVLSAARFSQNALTVGGTAIARVDAGASAISALNYLAIGGGLSMILAGSAPGTGYPRLQVAGEADLAGTLAVSLGGAFRPAIGDSFNILTWGLHSGTFSTLQLPDLGGRIQWNTSHLYDTNSGTISVDATYYAGDSNRDSHIDVADVSAMESALADLSAYQATHSPGGGALTDQQFALIGDFNGDNKVTNADLQRLINLLANGGGSGGGSLVAVPEPASVVLLLFASMIAWCRCVFD